MSRYWVGSSEWIDAVAVTDASAASERTGQEAANALNPDPRIPWRSNGLSSQYIQFNAGADLPYDYVSFIRWNGNEDATLTITDGVTADGDPAGYTANPVASGVADFGTDSANEDRATWEWIHTVYILSAQRTARYIRIAISNNDSDDADYIVGAVRIGIGWRFLMNPLYGATHPGWRKRGELTDLPAGGSAFARRTPAQDFVFTMQFNNATGLADWQANAYRIDRLQADHSPVVLVTDSDPSDGYLIQRTGYGMLVFGSPSRPVFGRITQTAQLQGWG